MNRLHRIADIFGTFAFMLILAAGVAYVANIGEREVTGIVTAVDGDSLEGQDGSQMRLRGIDAPEYSQNCDLSGEIWPCGKEAHKQLMRQVAEPGIYCKGGELDKYDRLLVTCRNKEDANLNAWMVRNGWALAFGDYYGEEKSAREEKLGIWSSRFDAPKDWRDKQISGGDDHLKRQSSLHDRDEDTLLNGLWNRVRLWIELLKFLK